ncbi:MAG: COG3014 family protein [Candidatus Binatia bacterium]
MKIQHSVTAAILVSVTVLGGCGTMMANNKDMKSARLHLQAGDVSAALAAGRKRDDLCGILDRAVLLHIQGNPAASNAEFDRGLALIKTYEDRAVVSANEVGRGAGSVLLNDKTLEYQGEGFEKVLIHAFKAQNYLMMGDEEGARVEIRNANMRQDEERRKHAEEIEAAKAEAGKQNLASFDDKVNNAFASSSSVLSRIDNVYQNPFATYLSGVVYEINGELDDAFLDFKNAYQMVPSPLIASDLSRLAARLQRQDELRELGIPLVQGPSNVGDTLVVLDDGLAPARAQLKFPIPAGNTVAAVAVPITEPVPSNLGEAVILDQAGNEIGRTSMLVDIEAMSVRNLHDRYPAILTRQAIRLAAKIAASNAAVAAAAQHSAEAKVLTQLFTSIGNVASEQADLRAWYQLPRSIHVARISVPTGQSSVTMRLLDLAGVPMRDVEVPVISAGGPLSVVGLRYLNGQAIALAPAQSPIASTAGGEMVAANLETTP